MITRFFNTSQPVHFVIVCLYVLLLFVQQKIMGQQQTFGLTVAGTWIGLYLAATFSVFVLAFLTTKNRLTARTNYKVLFCLLLLGIIPNAFYNDNIIMSNLFVLLAARRIFSVRNNFNTKKKLFDAAFWIAIATLFYLWAALFFLVILAAQLAFSVSHIKNYIVPFAGAGTVLIGYICYNILVWDSFGQLDKFWITPDLDVSAYLNPTYLIPLVVMGALGLWSVLMYLKVVNHMTRGERPKHLVLIAMLIMALGAAAFQPDKNGSELLFVAAPLAVIVSKHLEAVRLVYIREAYVWVLFVTPLALLLL